MPLTDGEYQKLTKEEIQTRLENSLENKLPTTAQPGDLVTKQLEAEAEVMAENQEEALERVHQAAYLADADGKELDKVVDVIGLNRIEATPATGTIELWRETPPTADYTVQKGALLQTAGASPIEFAITEKSSLDYIDGFEDGDLDKWTEDTGSFTAKSTGDLSGSYALEIPATDNVNVTSTQSDFRVGTTFTMEIQLATDSNTGFRFGLQDQSNYFECVLNETGQDLTLRLIESDSVVSSSTNSSATIPTASSYLEVEWSLYGDLTATIYETDSRDVEVSSVTFSESREWRDGAVSVASLGSTATALVDEITTRSVLANIRGVEGGVQTNVGPNRITQITNSMPGVEQVANPVSTGDQDKQNTEFNPLVIGRDEEEDEELRDRAFNSTSIGGAATVNALKTELERVDGVQALTLNRNRQDSSVNGLPAHSFEAVVYGGADEHIAETIFNTASIDSHDVGGVNGTKHTYSIQSDVTNDTEEIAWSRPAELTLDITLDLIVDDTYVGDTDIRSILADYIGGTDTDGSFITGLDVGEDVYEAILKRKVVGPDKTGVWEVDSLTIDKGNDGNDDTTTTASGADVLAVGSNEVAVTNARDGSITINTTTK